MLKLFVKAWATRASVVECTVGRFSVVVVVTAVAGGTQKMLARCS
jgi:hypothetical protein